MASGIISWSIALPEGCHCELCNTLGTFLADPEQKRLEWPLAKQGRSQQIDLAWLTETTG